MLNLFHQQFQEINILLNGASKVLIASHQNPDADAVASVLVIHSVLKNRNIESLPYLPDLPSSSLNFLPGFFEIKTQIDSFDPDIVFCVDYGDFKRLRLPKRISDKDQQSIITIDHHLDSDQRGEVKVLGTEFSSTAEILYHWLKYENFEIDQDIACCLLAGIFSDSGGFRHVSTSADTLNIAAELLLKGASLTKIAQATDFNRPLNLSQAWGQVLSRIQMDAKTGLAYSWFDIKDFYRFQVGFADFDGITNLISASSSLNLGLFLVEYEKGRVKGSLRSEPKGGKNVAEIVRSLGGGGHPYAAGFRQDGTIEDVLKKVLNLIE